MTVEKNILPILPANWTSAKLGEVIESLNPGFPSGKHNKDGRGVPHLRPMNITSRGEVSLDDLKYVEVTEYSTLKKGDILFNNTNSPALLGKTTYIKQDTNWAFSNHMTRLRVIEGLLNPAWTAYFLHNLFQVGYFKRNCTNHVNQASINTGFLCERVWLPIPPLPEQRRIVAKIEELFTKLDAGVESLKAAKRQIKRYRQAVLKAAVEGELTREWRVKHKGELEPASVLLERILRERRAKWEADQLAKMEAQGKTPKDDKWKAKYQEPATPDVNGLPQIPPEWKWVSVEALSTKVVDGVHKKPNYVPTGIPFVTVRNLTAGQGISFDKLNYITIEDHAEFIKRANPEKGDILISKDGTLGVTRVIRTNRVFSIFVSVALIKPVVYETSEYFGIALSSPQVQRQMVPKGSGLQHIHLEDLRADCIPLPPSEEQYQIVAEVERRLSVADEIETSLDAELKRAERLRQSILKRAFEGKLVPQDPSDEPASVLLERIKAEKASKESQSSDGKRAARGKKSPATRNKPTLPLE